MIIISYFCIIEKGVVKNVFMLTSTPKRGVKVALLLFLFLFQPSIIISIFTILTEQPEDRKGLFPEKSVVLKELRPSTLKGYESRFFMFRNDHFVHGIGE